MRQRNGDQMRATQLWHAIIACGTAAFLSGVASADNLQTAPPHLRCTGGQETGLSRADDPRAAGDWGVRVRGSGIGAGTFYMYRVTGRGTATKDAPFGTVLNGNFVLNDPYAYRTQDVDYSQFYVSPPFIDTNQTIYAGGGKSIVYDHAADPAPTHMDIRPEDLVMYELHVQDYTAQLSGLAPALRGTYLGLAQGGLKTPGGLSAGIDHLADLGVTAVELMPIMQYDKETTTAPGRVNHWGYMTTNFSAPEARYASRPG